MPESVVSNLDFPEIPETGYIYSTKDRVLFYNFEIGKSKPRSEHVNFSVTVVKHLIKQIDALGFLNDKSAKIYLFGNASATGKSDKNMALSTERAAAIGALLVAEFERQKPQSRIAKSITLVPVVKGEGDQFAREQLDEILLKNPKLHPRDKDIETVQAGWRSVLTRVRIAHTVVDEDKVVECRQLLKTKVALAKEPASQIDRILSDIEDGLGPEGKAAVGAAFELLKVFVKTQLKPQLKLLLEDIPEIALLVEWVDFAIPSEFKCVFEFRDSRGKTASYLYFGSMNQTGLGLITGLTQLLGLLGWLSKILGYISAFVKAAAAVGKKIETLDKIVEALEVLQKLEKKLLDSLKAPGGHLRKLVGAPAADLIIMVIESHASGELSVEAAGWQLVTFDRGSVYEIDTFAKPARTEVIELGGAPKLTLDFLGEGPEGLLGYQAHVILKGSFSLRNNLLGYAIGKGYLRPIQNTVITKL